jgi:hypothetical protein
LIHVLFASTPVFPGLSGFLFPKHNSHHNPVAAGIPAAGIRNDSAGQNIRTGKSKPAASNAERPDNETGL